MRDSDEIGLLDVPSELFQVEKVNEIQTLLKTSSLFTAVNQRGTIRKLIPNIKKQSIALILEEYKL